MTESTQPAIIVDPNETRIKELEAEIAEAASIIFLLLKEEENRSENIRKLTARLAKAQAEIERKQEIVNRPIAGLLDELRKAKEQIASLTLLHAGPTAEDVMMRDALSASVVRICTLCRREETSHPVKLNEHETCKRGSY